MRLIRRCAWPVAACAAALTGLGGCGGLTAAQNAGVAVGATVIGGNIPTSDIEQVYYLGMFDPQDQVPAMMYRVRVRGQSGMINTTKFASGWVRADLIDSLSTISHTQDGKFEVTRADDKAAALTTGRRMMMFGPEGFREAPKDHRLVVVMGADPQKFFAAIDEALGVVAAATQGGSGVEVQRKLFYDLAELRAQRERLDDLRQEAGDRK
jgi:hypothetical protein